MQSPSGKCRGGIRFIEEAILRREQEGYQAADWCRIILCEVYLEIIGEMKNYRSDLVENLPILLKVMVTASSRIHASMSSS